MRHLTAGQHALLETALLHRLTQLDRRLAEHLGGTNRTEHAQQLLEQDNDDAPQHEGERALDMALIDRDTLSVGEVQMALARLQTGEYGICSRCGADIPFDRLRAEPWAVRCVPCQGAREASR